jgi:hypothetical protein
MWGAFHGISIFRTDGEDGVSTSGIDADYGPFGNRLLWGMRENEVLQAVMRFGREEEGDERGATVYVHTAALPEWVGAKQDLAEIKHWYGEKNGKRRVIEAIRAQPKWESSEWRVKDVHEWVNDGTNSGDKEWVSTEPLHERTILNHLKNLMEIGFIEGEQGGRGNAWRFSNIHLEDAGLFGYVKFETDTKPADVTG